MQSNASTSSAGSAGSASRSALWTTRASSPSLWSSSSTSPPSLRQTAAQLSRCHSCAAAANRSLPAWQWQSRRSPRQVRVQQAGAPLPLTPRSSRICRGCAASTSWSPLPPHWSASLPRTASARQCLPPLAPLWWSSPRSSPRRRPRHSRRRWHSPSSRTRAQGEKGRRKKRLPLPLPPSPSTSVLFSTDSTTALAFSTTRASTRRPWPTSSSPASGPSSRPAVMGSLPLAVREATKRRRSGRTWASLASSGRPSTASSCRCRSSSTSSSNGSSTFRSLPSSVSLSGLRTRESSRAPSLSFSSLYATFTLPLLPLRSMPSRTLSKTSFWHARRRLDWSTPWS
mmetsp:Transcript_16630/g.64936  ORF Transcript_16630/g.64936 Transcript_16630/m.64936 type:complete len:342 (+) Transcript_16630:1265-2290(+)